MIDWLYCSELCSDMSNELLEGNIPSQEPLLFLSRALSSRMSLLQLKLPDLVRRICLNQEGSANWQAVKKKRNAVDRVIKGQVNPHLSSLLAIVEALGGRLVIEWDEDLEAREVI